MDATVAAPAGRVEYRTEEVSFARLLWVAPLTVAAALAVNFVIKPVAQTIDPSLSRMGQLQSPLVTLTVEGALAAIVVFALVGWLVPRPIFWYRVVAAVALAISLLPDLALAIGGRPMMTAMRVVGPLTSIGAPSGPPGGGPPPGGFPGGALPGMPLEQVLVLMLLHVATATVCVVLLTILARRPAAAAR
jgi:hypothetical protein